MPHTFKQYIHRVGRTARAGRNGRSVTLVGENDRKLLKEAVKNARDKVKKRTVPPEVVQKYRDKIALMESEISDISREEKSEKEVNFHTFEKNQTNKTNTKSNKEEEEKKKWKKHNLTNKSNKTDGKG